jgi:Domain of unknown function (DUF1995)
LGHPIHLSLCRSHRSHSAGRSVWSQVAKQARRAAHLPPLSPLGATARHCAQVEEAEARGKAVILINPILRDIPSSGGIMGVRGRDSRLAFEQTLAPAYHFRLLYFSGSWYPILGALRYAHGGKWQVRVCYFPMRSCAGVLRPAIHPRPCSRQECQVQPT